MQGRLLSTFAARAGLRTDTAIAEALSVHRNSVGRWMADEVRLPSDVISRCRTVLMLDASKVDALVAAGDSCGRGES